MFKTLLMTWSLLCLLPSASLFAQSAEDSEWLRLGHYIRGERGLAGIGFFLSPDGARHPDSEWLASLQALREPASGPKDESAACRFPARRLYFQNAGLLPQTNLDCPAFERWRQSIRFSSISVVFSTAYAGNSASMFGHTLLKLNGSKSASSGGMLDYGVAFLADSGGNTGVMHTLRGLFGGYPGYFTIQPYYELINQYAYGENRDLWELELSLSAYQADLLLAHLWELQAHAHAPYYFTHVNCASMLAELLDVVRPDWELRASVRGLFMPSELVRLSAEREDGKVSFRPSQRRQWQDRMEGLDGLQRLAFADLWDRQAVDSRDPLVLDTLIDRVNVEKSKKVLSEQNEVRLYEDRLLLARSGLPAGVTRTARTPGNNPMLAHAPRRVRVSGGQLDDQGYFGLGLRNGWHDLLDSPLGFEPFYQLNFFDVRASRNTRKEWSGELKIAEVWSLAPTNEFESISSWTLGGGFRYQDDSWQAHLRGTAGWSQDLFGMHLSLLPGLEFNPELAPMAMDGKVLILGQSLIRWQPAFRSLVQIEPYLKWDGDAGVLKTFETRWDFDKSQQVQISLFHDEKLQAELGMARFF